MDAIGGGVLVAVAAALWIAYLVPSWLGRRQYEAHERNAVRLQQTLRILAETAETPEPVRLEATAREVAAQQRLLREREEKQRLETEAVQALAAAERRTAATAAARARKSADAVSGRSLRRRRRALSSLGLLLSLVTVVAGVVTLGLGGSWIVLAAGGIGMLAAVGALGALARVARAPVASVAPAAAAAPRFEPVEWAEEAPAVRSWTPQPLPKPLHLERGTVAASAMASMDAAAELRKAAAAVALEQRAAELAPKPVELTPRPVEAEPVASRFARMGIVEETSGTLDLDAVLRRRRAG